MKLRSGRGGSYFLGCAKYPKCKGTREVSEELLEKVSRDSDSVTKFFAACGSRQSVALSRKSGITSKGFNMLRITVLALAANGRARCAPGLEERYQLARARRLVDPGPPGGAACGCDRLVRRQGHVEVDRRRCVDRQRRLRDLRCKVDHDEGISSAIASFTSSSRRRPKSKARARAAAAAAFS